jgi:hypothetical protein
VSGSSVRLTRNCFWLLCLLLLLGTIAVLAVGGRPDPPGLGRTLDGPWRFHAGNDLRWAAPAIDDVSWDRVTLRSDPTVHDGDVGIPGYLDGWHAHGHPALEGYGWYRRRLKLPPQRDLVVVGPPLVDDAYDMFWNGHRIGGVGRSDGSKDVTSTRPLVVPLPVLEGARDGVLAVRAFMQPGIDRDAQSGGLRTVPVLAPRAEGEILYRAQWRRTIAGYIVEVVEPAAMLVLAGLAVGKASSSRHRAFAYWTALALIFSALLRVGNAMSAWTDLVSLPALTWQDAVILAPLAKLTWTIAWNQWTEGRDRRIVLYAAMLAWMVLVGGELSHREVVPEFGRLVFAACFVTIALRIFRRGEHKAAALIALLLTIIAQFASDLSGWGVPSIWFPFNIGVSRTQFAYALFLPLLAHLLLTWLAKPA